MNIRTVCTKCGKEMPLTDANINLDSITLYIKSCTNIDCYDCSKCEETLKQKNSELKTQIKTLKNKLSRIAGEAVK